MTTGYERTHKMRVPEQLVKCPHCYLAFPTNAGPGARMECPHCGGVLSIPNFAQSAGIRDEDDEPTSFVVPKEKGLMNWFLVGAATAFSAFCGYYTMGHYPHDEAIRLTLAWFIGVVMGGSVVLMRARSLL